jgi:hypothetical protein
MRIRDFIYPGSRIRDRKKSDPGLLPCRNCGGSLAGEHRQGGGPAPNTGRRSFFRRRFFRSSPARRWRGRRRARTGPTPYAADRQSDGRHNAGKAIPRSLRAPAVRESAARFGDVAAAAAAFTRGGRGERAGGGGREGVHWHSGEMLERYTHTAGALGAHLPAAEGAPHAPAEQGEAGAHAQETHLQHKHRKLPYFRPVRKQEMTKKKRSFSETGPVMGNGILGKKKTMD